MSRPNHVVAFVRPKPRQPPNFATFIVPLQFNKLDFRDYLYHVYNVEVNAVRSFINEQAPQRRHNGEGRWYRPRSQKMMMVELVKPFVWPDVPSDLSPWDKSFFDAEKTVREQEWDERTRWTEGHPRSSYELQKMGRHTQPKELYQQAQELLEGKRKWASSATLDEKWIEVEQDVDVVKESKSQEGVDASSETKSQ